jgi:multicomponent Na+:H+ antiporter subunit C
MTLLLGLTIGAIAIAGFYNMMRRSIVTLAVGLILLSHAANLLLFSSNGLVRGKPPLIEAGASLPPEGFADPLPQALILTAIVINFGMLVFALILLHRTRRAARTDRVDELQVSE